MECLIIATWNIHTWWDVGVPNLEVCKKNLKH